MNSSTCFILSIGYAQVQKSLFLWVLSLVVNLSVTAVLWDHESRRNILPQVGKTTWMIYCPQLKLSLFFFPPLSIPTWYQWYHQVGGKDKHWSRAIISASQMLPNKGTKNKPESDLYSSQWGSIFLCRWGNWFCNICKPQSLPSNTNKWLFRFEA